MQNVLALQQMSEVNVIHGGDQVSWSTLSAFLCRSDVSYAVC
jgi:hypothetical protein